MNQEKIGKFILELRKKNNLTQKDLADKLGVTYQAVSKWENGKNIPDIAIIKEISKQFDVDVSDILDIDLKNDKKDNKLLKIILVVVMLLVLVLLVIIQMNYSNNNTFEFKAIKSNCENFNVSGSIAFNSNKSSLHISEVEYCGVADNTVYDKISCSLYEVSGDKLLKIKDCDSKGKNITLNAFLEDLEFNIDSYSSICKKDSKRDLSLEIVGVKNGLSTTYKVPMELTDKCK